ncbi:MAG: sigma-70 family RNA polymerase sigma factor [Solirubrobacterales bacterium]|nr:sigma-70 family RNA polymerase sigma factor [Solirubrobacterales bacterium]
MACLETPLSSLSDETLARLVAAGSDDAFAEIDGRYRTRLVRYARGIAAGDAEDAVQDAMVRAVRALRRGSRPDALAPWLHRIVRNCALDLVAARRRAPVAELEDHLHPVAEDAGAAVERRQQMRSIVTGVGTLPATQRSALVLRELEGRTYADIAQELDVTVPAVKSLLVRARAGLKRAREAAVFVPFPGLLARLQSAIEPLTAAATPKVACVAVVVAGAVPAVAPKAADPVPDRGPRAVQAPRATPVPTGTAGVAAAVPDRAQSLAVDCVDGWIDQQATRPELLRALRGLEEQSEAYSGCRTALVQALTRQ